MRDRSQQYTFCAIYGWFPSLGFGRLRRGRNRGSRASSSPGFDVPPRIEHRSTPHGLHPLILLGRDLLQVRFVRQIILPEAVRDHVERPLAVGDLYVLHPGHDPCT